MAGPFYIDIFLLFLVKLDRQSLTTNEKELKTIMRALIFIKKVIEANVIGLDQVNRTLLLLIFNQEDFWAVCKTTRCVLYDNYRLNL